MPKRSDKKLKRNFEILLKIADAVVQVAAIEKEHGNLNSKEGQKYGRVALDLAALEFDLLWECSQKFGCNFEVEKILADLKYWGSLSSEHRSGVWLENEPLATLVSRYASKLGQYCHPYYDVPKNDDRCFINQLHKWANELVIQGGLPKETYEVHSEPPKEARIAYQLYHGMGRTQESVADAVSHEFGRKITQGQVSRLIRQYKEWLRIQGLPLEKDQRASKPESMDNDKLDLGWRTDGHRTGDPRNLKKYETEH